MDGFVRCINPACVRIEVDEHGVEREIPTPDRAITFRHEVFVNERKPGDLPLDVTSTEHLVPENDADLACPNCGTPGAILRQAPPTYPRMV